MEFEKERNRKICNRNEIGTEARMLQLLFQLFSDENINYINVGTLFS